MATVPNSTRVAAVVVAAAMVTHKHLNQAAILLEVITKADMALHHIHHNRNMVRTMVLREIMANHPHK